jgi:addiction module HigA family antidote
VLPKPDILTTPHAVLRRMMMTKKPVKIPGEVLKNEYLAVYQLPISKVAKEISISSAQLNNIVNNKQKISISVALRLAKFFDTTLEYWVNLQNTYDLAQAVKDSELTAILKNIKKAQKPKIQARLVTFKRGRPAKRVKQIRPPAVKKAKRSEAKAAK